MTKREKIKLFIVSLVLIPGAVFVVSDEMRTYKTTGCVGFFQKARPLFEQMPRGVSFTADELEYTCSWDKKKTVVRFGATLIIAGGALSKWKKIKTRNQTNIQPPI